MPCSGAEPSDVIVISEKSKRIRVLLMAAFASFQMQFAHGRPSWKALLVDITACVPVSCSFAKRHGSDQIGHPIS